MSGAGGATTFRQHCHLVVQWHPMEEATQTQAPTRRDAPPASSDAVRKSMQGNKRRDTKPELIVRKMLRDMGYVGYRLDWKKAHGHPDIAFPGRKIAIYVMGCSGITTKGASTPPPPSNMSSIGKRSSPATRRATKRCALP